MKETMCRSEWEKLIDEWIFNERDRQIMKRRFLDGITYEKLADEFQLSDRQVKNICKKGMQRLVNHT